MTQNYRLIIESNLEIIIEFNVNSASIYALTDNEDSKLYLSFEIRSIDNIGVLNGELTLNTGENLNTHAIDFGTQTNGCVDTILNLPISSF